MTAEEKIKKAFLECYQNKYFDKITVKKVCQNAKVSRATFYTYFEDLQSLLSEIESIILSEIGEILATWQYVSLEKVNYRQQPFKVFLKCNEYVVKNYAAYVALWGKYANRSFTIKYHRMVEKSCYDKWIEEGFSIKIATLLAASAAGAIIDSNELWITTYFKQNKHEINSDEKKFTAEEIALHNTQVVGALYELGLRLNRENSKKDIF